MSNLQNWAGIQNVNWIPVLNNPINLGSQFKIVPTEGYLAWEYNPLRNYRLSQNMYEKDGKYYTQNEFTEILKTLNSEFTLFKSNGIPKKDDDIKMIMVMNCLKNLLHTL